MDNDRLLIFDESPAGLAKVSPKKLIQSLPATATATGAVQIASGSNVTDPFNATTVETAFSPTQAINCPIFAKAWADVSSALDFDATSGTITLDSDYNINTVALASKGVVNFTFTDSVPSANYVVLVTNANYTTGGTLTEASRAIVSSKTTSGFTVTFYEVDDGNSALTTPRNAAILVFGT